MKKITSLKLFILINFIICGSAFSDEAQVILLRGKAYYKPQGKRAILLERGNIIKKNGLLFTEEKSFLRIRFKDNSTLNLGPESTMAMSHETNSKPKLMELIRGKIRGVINPKDQPQKGYNHKMIIKTRSASIGVRGTDFLVVYNEKNHITSNITLKGEVDLYKKPDEEIYESIREEFDLGGKTVNYSQNDDLEEISANLNHYDSKRIPPGHFSGAFPSYEKSISAVKVSDQQLMALGRNKNLNTHGRSSKDVLTNNYTLGKGLTKNDQLVPSPRGEEKLSKEKYNVVKNDQGIRHGGIVDLQTGIYIAPPEGSQIDPKTGKFLLPDELGGINPQTGEYVPPKGVDLHPINGFTLTEGIPQDRNIRENLNKLKNLTGSFNEQLGKALNIFKEVTRLDMHGFANYQFTTNVLENYYGEFRRVTNLPSMLWNLQGFAGFQLFHNQTWLIYPKASLAWQYYERSLAPIKELNQFNGMLGGEIHHKHRLFGFKARFITDLQFRTRYMDYRRRNLYDFYTEDSSFKFMERFSLNRYNHFSTYYQIMAYQGFRDNDHGNIHNIGVTTEHEIGRSWHLLLGGEFSYRRDKINNQRYKISNGYLKLKWVDLLPKSDLTFGYTYQYHNTRIPIQFGDASYYKADVLFHRRLGDFWKVNLLYEFDRQRAKGIPFGGERRSFIRQTWGGGLTMVF